MSLTIAVTGLNATDNPAPGVPVIRSIRAGCAAANTDCHIVGLAYDVLDPGNYMADVADDVYLMPFPSQGADVLLTRLEAICTQRPIDVLIPCLDSELSAYLRIQDALRDLGVHLLLPDEAQLKLRSKASFDVLAERLGIPVPKSVVLTDPAKIDTLRETLDFPVMVKGQFYDAYLAHTPLDVRMCFDRLASKWGLPVIVQQFVPGTEFDVACVGDGQGGVMGQVAMRKMQLTDKGKAWGGVTVCDPALDAFVADTVARLKWRGPCEIEVMKAHDDGGLYLIEINPRFPAWIYLSVGAGRNLPWLTVQLALGHTVEPLPPAPAGVLFLRNSVDQICLMDDFQSLTTTGELHKPARPEVLR